MGRVCKPLRGCGRNNERNAPRSGKPLPNATKARRAAQKYPPYRSTLPNTLEDRSVVPFFFRRSSACAFFSFRSKYASVHIKRRSKVTLIFWFRFVLNRTRKCGFYKGEFRRPFTVFLHRTCPSLSRFASCLVPPCSLCLLADRRRFFPRASCCARCHPVDRPLRVADSWA